LHIFQHPLHQEFDPVPFSYQSEPGISTG
jgi:hypothetical protein